MAKANKKKNILAFTPYYPPHIGGLEKYAEELYEHLSLAGHHVTVFTPNIPTSKPVEEKDNLIIIRFPAWEIIFNYPIPAIWHPNFWNRLKLALEKQPDIIMSTTRFFLTSPLAGFLAKIKQVPWLHLEHGSDYVTSKNIIIGVIARLYDEIIGRLVFKLSSQNIAPSNSAARFSNKFDSRSIPTIYRGIPYQEIDQIKPNKEIQKQYPNQTIIVFAGRLISGKGVPNLIKALSEINNSEITVLILGSGPEKTNIEEIIKTHHLENQVHLLGPKTFTETISTLKSADIMVNPSYNEGLPTIVLEAAACKTAIIATDVGGTSEIVTHHKSALLYHPADTTKLVQHIIELTNEPTTQQRLTSNAELAVIQKFDWQRAIKKYEKIIYDIQQKT